MDKGNIDVTSLSTKELEELAFHNISVENIMKIANPLGCWMELDREITKEEVMKCVESKDYEVVDTPLWSKISKDTDPQVIRDNHIKKIAYFVVNEPEEPIRLDIGFPGFGGGNIYNFHIIEDGNHRLSGAYIAGKEHIKSSLMGCIDYAKELGLYNPNIYELELTKRYDQEFLEIKEKELNEFVNKLNDSKVKKKNGNYEIPFKMSDLNKYDDLLMNLIDKKETLNERETLFQSFSFEDVESKSFIPESKITLTKKEAKTLFGKELDKKRKLKM